MSNFSSKYLFAEKSLFDIYKISRKIRPNTFNVIITSLVFLSLLIYVNYRTGTLSQVIDILRVINSDAFGFSSSILGFLVAGLAIFLTITKPEMFVLMLRANQPDTGSSYLKYNLAAFIHVFIHYLGFVGVCILFKIFCAPLGPASFFFELLPVDQAKKETIKIAAVLGFFVIFNTWFTYVLLLLKSFVYNMYHVVMTVIAFQLDETKQLKDD